jgi:hypothetical protein
MDSSSFAAAGWISVIDKHGLVRVSAVVFAIEDFLDELADAPAPSSL